MATQDEYIKTALRLPRALHAEIQASAEDRGRSMNAEIITRLQKSYEQQEKPKPEPDILAFLLLALNLSMKDALSPEERKTIEAMMDDMFTIMADRLGHEKADLAAALQKRIDAQKAELKDKPDQKK